MELLYLLDEEPIPHPIAADSSIYATAYQHAEPLLVDMPVEEDFLENIISPWTIIDVNLGGKSYSFVVETDPRESGKTATSKLERIKAVCSYIQTFKLDNVADRLEPFLYEYLHCSLLRDILREFLRVGRVLVVVCFQGEPPIYLRIFFAILSPLVSAMKRLKLCLTMPWTIWPALVVLWGVCWMFYSENGSAEPSPWGFPIPESHVGEVHNQRGKYLTFQLLRP